MFVQAEKWMKVCFLHLRWRLDYGGVSVMEYGLREALTSGCIKRAEAATDSCTVFNRVPLYWAQRIGRIDMGRKTPDLWNLLSFIHQLEAKEIFLLKLRWFWVSLEWWGACEGFFRIVTPGLYDWNPFLDLCVVFQEIPERLCPSVRANMTISKSRQVQFLARISPCLATESEGV